MRTYGCFLFAAFLGPAIAPSPAQAADAPARIVFLGDSITDGHTLPLLVRHALAEAKQPVPTCINAGVASDTAALMRARLERDVLPRRPTLVTLSAGANDVFRGVKPENYEADVNAIVERLKAAKVPVILLTPSVLGPKHEAVEKKLADYSAALRRVADKHGSKIADVHEAMKRDRAAGKDCIEPDQVHLTFAGYQAMARAVLDALDHKAVAVPKELKLEMMPGVVATWRIRVRGEKEAALDEKTVLEVKAEDGKKYTLPEQEPQKHWWLDQERQRGFALSLDKQVGAGKAWVGVAVIDAATPKKVFFNTGSSLNAVWLNGKRLYRNEAWTGWHAGKEHIAAELKEGKNAIVIETGSQFFLSLTETNDW